MREIAVFNSPSQDSGVIQIFPGDGDRRVVYPFTGNDHLCGLDDNLEVECEAGVLHVPQIESRFIVGANVATADDLRPSSQSGPDQQSCLVPFRLVARQEGTGADERHLSAQDADELGELIEARAAEQVAEA